MKKMPQNGSRAWFYDKKWIYFVLNNKTKNYGMH